MSNFANIQRTIFVDLPNKTETYGYRIYDDYGIEFDNTMTKEDLELPHSYLPVMSEALFTTPTVKLPETSSLPMIPTYDRYKGSPTVYSGNAVDIP